MVFIIFTVVFILAVIIVCMIEKHIKEEELLIDEILKKQPTKCDCGFPLRPVGRTYRTCLGGEKRVLVEHEIECFKCKKINKIIG